MGYTSRSRILPVAAWFCLVLCGLYSTGCNKAPPPVAPVAATVSATPAPAPSAARGGVGRTTSPGQPRPQAKPAMSVGERMRLGLMPGTDAYTKKQKDAANQALANLEAPFVEEIEKNWNKVLDLKNRTQPSPAKIEDTGLPIPADAMTEMQGFRKLYELRLGEVSTYKETTQDPPEVRELGERFLTAYVAKLTHQPEGASEKKNNELRQEMIKAGSKDPVIRLHLALLRSNEADLQDAEKQDLTETFNQLFTVFDSDPKYARYFCYQSKSITLNLIPQTDARLFDQITIESMIEYAKWLESATRTSQPLDAVWTRVEPLLRESKLDRTRHLYKAVLERKGIDPWIVHMIAAWYHQRQGWEYRGGGFADKVSDEGWKKLAEHQNLSMKHALYAWSLQPKIAAAPGMMMGYSLTEHDMGSPTEWFLRTIALNCDEFTPYGSLENSLKPRWGGSIDRLVTLAKACLRTPRFDTAIPPHGLEILIRIQEQEMPPGRSIFDDQSIHDVLVEYVAATDKAVAAAAPGTIIPANYPHNRSALAALLTLAGDLPHARDAQKPTANDVSSKYYRRLQLRGNYAIGRVLADLPELSEPLGHIDQAIKKGVNADAKPEDFDPILNDIKLVREKFSIPDGSEFPPDEEAARAFESPETAVKEWVRWYVLNSEAAVTRMKQYATGQPLELTVSKGVPGWDLSCSDWEVKSPNEILVRGDAPGPQYQLLSLARFEPPYDVQVTVKDNAPELKAGPGGMIVDNRASAHNVGIGLGSTDNASYVKQNNGMRQFGVYPLGGSAAVWKTWQDTTPPHQPVPTTDRSYRIRVKVWKDGHFVFSVNGVKVAEETDAEFRPRRDVSFGSALRWNNPASITLSQMRIRKLPYGPRPDSETDYPAQEAYARQLIAAEPEDGTAWYELVKSLVGQEKYPEAMEAIQQVNKLVPYTEVYDSDYLFAKATCLAETGDFEAAMKAFESVRRGYFRKPNEKNQEAISVKISLIQSIAPELKLRNGRVALTTMTALNQHHKFSRWDHLWVLACAQAETGDFESASRRIAEARVLAPEAKKPFLEQLEKLFAEKKPYRFQASEKKAPMEAR